MLWYYFRCECVCGVWGGVWGLGGMGVGGVGLGYGGLGGGGNSLLPRIFLNVIEATFNNVGKCITEV